MVPLGARSGKNSNQRTPDQTGVGIGKKSMNLHDTKNFKATALDEDTLRREAPSIFALGPMAGVSYEKVEVMQR